MYLEGILARIPDDYLFWHEMPWTVSPVPINQKISIFPTLPPYLAAHPDQTLISFFLNNSRTLSLTWIGVASISGRN